MDRRRGDGGMLDDIAIMDVQSKRNTDDRGIQDVQPRSKIDGRSKSKRGDDDLEGKDTEEGQIDPRSCINLQV